MKHLKQFSILWLAFVLVSCASLGIPETDTFNKRVLAAQGTVTEIRETAELLLGAGQLTADEAVNIQTQATSLRQGIDAARALHIDDPLAAENRLTIIITALTALQASLNARKVIA